MERLKFVRSGDGGGRANVVAIVVLVGLALLIFLSIFVIFPAVRASRVRRMFEEARAHEKAGDAEEAEAIYTRITIGYPEMGEAAEAQAEIVRLSPILRAAAAEKHAADFAFREKRFEEALRIYREIVEKYPQSRRAGEAKASIPACARMACRRLLDEAETAMAQERWDDADNRLERLRAIDPEYPGLDEKISATREKLDAFAAARRNAAIAEESGLLAKALAALDSALAILPHDEKTYAERIRILKAIRPPEGMVLVLPGEFVVGSDGGGRDERPRRRLRSDGFYMDRTEVTNARYAEFVAATGQSPPLHWADRSPGEEAADLPVVGVTWSEASAYAAWAGKRLPTAVEWERAARGDSGRTYPWGDSFDSAAGVFSLSAAPVGELESDRSAEGCMDMGGNVSEWTASDGPGGTKEIRGASWAGFERGRSNPLVAPRPGAANTFNTILADHAKTPSLVTNGAETEFFLRHVHEEIAFFEIRKWLADEGRYVSGHFSIRSGEPIRGERIVRREDGSGRPGEKMKFETGCRLLRINHPKDPKRVSATFAGSIGVERTVGVFSGPLPEPTCVSLVQRSEKDSDADIEKEMDAVHNRDLSEIARSANRLYAPPESRFANCGFRCARDVRQAENN